MTTHRFLAAAFLILPAATAALGQVAPPPRPEELAESSSQETKLSRSNLIITELRAGRAPEALSMANEMLRSYPDDIFLNCAAGEAAVAGNDRLALHLVVERLKKLSPEGDHECKSRLFGQYDRLSGMAGVRERALDLVKLGKLDEARRSVVAAHLDPHEDLLIEHYLDRAQGHFASALSSLQQLSRLSPPLPDASSLQEATLQQGRQFTTARTNAQTYLFDPVATSACRPESAREMFNKKGLNLLNFMTIARDLVREYPSNQDVQQMYFMALVLVGTDESVKRYGDFVLDRYGVLTIPFFSRDNLLLLVVDRRHHRVTLKDNPAHPANLGLTDGLRNGRNFDLTYSGVLSLRQTVSNELNTFSLSEKSAALDFGEQGVAPYYALMTAIHCLYGEKFQRRATERLGRFLAGELGLPAEHVKLVDPAGTTHDVLGEIVSAVTIVSMATSQASIQHQTQVAIGNATVRANLPLQQLEANQVEISGQEIISQLADDTLRRLDLNDEHRYEEESMEQQLVQEGFDRAADLDVPGYLEVLAKMLRSKN